MSAADRRTSQPRYRDLSRDELDERQRDVYDAIAAGPRNSVPSIFHLYLNSPELCQRIQSLGAFCRYETSFPPHQSEIVILTVARHFDAAYEWSIHVREARKAGISEDVIRDIEALREPASAEPETRLLWRFTKTYLATNAVPDDLFDEAMSAFGRKSVIELAGLIGYYAMLAMALRIFEVPPQS